MSGYATQRGRGGQRNCGSEAAGRDDANQSGDTARTNRVVVEGQRAQTGQCSIARRLDQRDNSWIVDLVLMQP